MPHRQVINIRGANASGKTTLARRFLGEEGRSLGPGFADAKGKVHQVNYTTRRIEGLDLLVHVLGTYDESKYSGCDKIKSVDVIRSAVAYAARHLPGHVVFEGFYVSKSWEPYAELRNRMVREANVKWLWVLLHAPLELIYERAQARAPDRELDRKELAAVVRQMNNTRVKAMSAFGEDTMVLNPALPPDELFSTLVGQLRLREERGA